MSINLLESVQQSLCYPELQKIDSTTQLIIADDNTIYEDKFSQAAIPAVLTGLYKYVQSDEGATEFLKSGNYTNWMNILFDDKKKEVIETISDYAGLSNEKTIVRMNAIATEAVKSVKENLPADATIKDIKTFLTHQKNNILLYLLPVLNIGELLHDNTLDDGTNKMEGPVSSLIRSIGDVFSGSDTGKKNQELNISMKKNMEQNY